MMQYNYNALQYQLEKIMTPSTQSRIARLYEAIIGYDPRLEGWTWAEALDGLQWMRTASFFCPDDYSLYTGETLTGPQLRALRRNQGANIMKIWALVTDSDAGTFCELFNAEHLRDARCMELCTNVWDSRRDGPIPDDWRTAYEALEARGCDWWVHLSEHDVFLPMAEPQGENPNEGQIPASSQVTIKHTAERIMNNLYSKTLFHIVGPDVVSEKIFTDF
jgi:hypothetical protein